MININNQTIGKNLDNAIGGLANESRFERDVFEKEYIREHRRFTLPALNNDGLLIIEQGWNEQARKRRVIKVLVEQDDREVEMFFRMIDLEQAVFAMTQADEALKYVKTSARSQRVYEDEARQQKPVEERELKRFNN